MNVLDLFSGIGGFSLGLERAGMRAVAFCELDPFCRAVLRKHWPSVPIYSDVRSLHAAALPDRVDVVAGGFPCQDISFAGKGAGLDGERSGLWWEYHRIIDEVRPRYAIIENVSALRSRGLDAVLGSLAAIGYDAEWHCIPASAVGAPHRRDRIWIVAYAARELPHGAGACGTGRAESSDGGSAVAHAHEPRLEGRLRESLRECARQWAARAGGAHVADADVGSDERGVTRSVLGAVPGRAEASRYRDAWLAEPDVGRVAHGVPARVDRLRALGNAVVPQVVEMIGKAIMQTEAACTTAQA